MIPLYYPGDRVVVREDLLSDAAYTIGSYEKDGTVYTLKLPVSMGVLEYKGEPVTISSVHFTDTGFYVYTIEENSGIYFTPEMFSGKEEDQVLQDLDGIEDFLA